MTACGDDLAQPGDDELQPIDLVLGEGTLPAQARAWQRAAESPAAMLALAEARALVEQCRLLQTEPSPTFAIQLAEVVAKAERRLAPPRRERGWPIGLAAAALTFIALQCWDPLGRPPALLPAAVAQGPARDVVVAPEAAAEAIADSREVAWSHDVEAMRRRLGFEASPHLREALEAGLDQAADPLGGWLDPRNELMRRQLAHELRSDAAVRQQALRGHGGLAAVDERVQQLADALAPQLLDTVIFGTPVVEAVASGVRALVAAGPGGEIRQRAVDVGGRWLARECARLADADAVVALAALVELSAVTGVHHAEIARAGDRLLTAVLGVDDDNWSRRLPELLRPGIRPGVLAEASRVLARLPAFGLPVGRCAVVRQLLLGPLRERRAGGEDTPELVAALLYGSADLLGGEEREQLERMLRRWKPAHLVADLATVQQVAWALEPGRRGFTRQQAELRQLAVLEDPQDLARRGRFVLVLATNYAAWVGGVLPRATGS